MVPWSIEAPLPRDRLENYPTLLYSWWCTGFSLVIIITRVCGRKVRSNVLFREDWIMLLALIPLLARMALVHVVLIYGTNNIKTTGYHFTAIQLHNREIGSRLVLAARIFYAMFIWASKLTVSEFLKRITIRIWRRSYEVTLHCIRVFLFLTFFAVVIATLTECRPFDDYWQVIPDPGPQCRQGYAHLISMGTCDIITDVLLIAFPIPIMLQSGQTWKRKVQLAALFSLSIVMIAVTATRVPEVIQHLGRQQYRTVWASSEILASTAVSNAVILGSFVRDRGTKKNKYRSQSVTDSIDRVSTRRATITALQQTGSDEDLFRFLGCRVPEHLQDESDTLVRPAPAAMPAPSMQQTRKGSRLADMAELRVNGAETMDSESDDSLRKAPATDRTLPSPAPSTKRSVSFFDIGGLLEDGKPSLDSRSRSRSTTLVGSSPAGTVAQDFAPPTPQQSRRGSRAFLSDIGGLLPLSSSRTGDGTVFTRRRSDAQSSLQRHQSAPIGGLGSMPERKDSEFSLYNGSGSLGTTSETAQEEPQATTVDGSSTYNAAPQSTQEGSMQELQDAGGILSPGHRPDASSAALQRVTEPDYQPSHTEANAAAPRRTESNELHISDPGGLLG